MKNCPNCSAPLEDNAAFCPNCGAPLNGQAPYQDYGQPIAPPAWDHTAEYAAEDIAKGKVFALSCYALSIVGVILTLLGAKDSRYAMFHVGEALKLTIVEAVVSLITALLCWTVIVPIAGVVLMVMLLVVHIMCFVDVCKNEAKEPWLIRSLKFLQPAKAEEKV